MQDFEDAEEEGSFEDVKEVGSYVYCANQCRILKGVMDKVCKWAGEKLPSFAVKHLMHIRNTGQALVEECTVSGTRSSYGWLKRALLGEVRREDFSMVLVEFQLALDAFMHDNVFWLICRPDTTEALRVREEAGHLLSAASENLCDAAAKDLQCLISQLEGIVKAPSHHKPEIVEIARFLLPVMMVRHEGPSDWDPSLLESHRISSSIIECTTKDILGVGGNASVFKATLKGFITNIAVKENMWSRHHENEVETMLGTCHQNVMRAIAYCSLPPKQDQEGDGKNLLLMELMDGDLKTFLDEFFKSGISKVLL